MIVARYFVRPMMLVGMIAGLSGCIETPPVPDMRNAVTASGAASVAVPFILDDNRVYVEVAFVKHDGSLRKTLAFVNMGSGSFVLTNTLYRELDVGKGDPLHVELGGMDIAVDAAAVQPETMANSIAIQIDPFSKRKSAAAAAESPDSEQAGFAAPMIAEAILPPGFLEHFSVVFDYGTKTMTLAAPGTVKPDGVAVPIRVNPQTGFAVLDVTVDGKAHPAVLDDGGSYGIVSNVIAADWLGAHPGWLRSEGGVGESNLTMGAVDVGAPVLKIPDVEIGALKLDAWGTISPSMPGLLGGVAERLFWNWYSEKAGERVEGAICGNTLKSFRLTLDYAGRMSYWQQEAPLDAHDLDQVGLTLIRTNGVAVVGGIAKKDGVETVSGVQPGDKLIQIDDLKAASLTRGALLSALHGMPGTRKHLVLERDGKTIEVDAVVTAF